MSDIEGPQSPTLTLIAGGDVGPVIQPVDRLVEKILPTLLEADFRLAQCERTYSVRGKYQGWATETAGHHSRLGPDWFSIFPAAQIDVVSLASNHVLDFGWDALEDTINMFEAQGIRVVGAGRTEEEAHRPAIIEANGVRVAILSYCSVVRDGQQAVGLAPGLAMLRARTWYEPTTNQPGCPPLVMTEPNSDDVATMESDIRDARSKADAVVLFLHWGIHAFPKIVAPYQPIIARAAIDAGADIVIGHHPHMVKAAEEYHGKYCFYSVGNFLTTGNVINNLNSKARWNLFWTEPYWDEGSLYTFPKECKHALLPKITFGKGGVVRVAAIPVYFNRLAQPERLMPGDPLFEEALDHLEWVSNYVPHQIRLEGDEFTFG